MTRRPAPSRRRFGTPGCGGRPLLPLAVLPVAVLAVLAVLAACTGTSPSGAAPAGTAAVAGPPLTAPTGFGTALEHLQTPAAGGLTTWETTWRLSWQPVPGASGYVARYRTSEGGGGPGARRRDLTAPVLRVQAAAGTSPAARLDRDRRAGLLFTSSQLLVQVAPRAAGGDGPWSPWYPVGDSSQGPPVAAPAPQHSEAIS